MNEWWGFFSLQPHSLSNYFYFNNGDVSSGYGCFTSHTLSQCEDSSVFNKIDDDVEKCDGDVISGCGFLTAT